LSLSFVDFLFFTYSLAHFFHFSVWSFANASISLILEVFLFISSFFFLSLEISFFIKSFNYSACFLSFLASSGSFSTSLIISTSFLVCSASLSLASAKGLVAHKAKYSTVVKCHLSLPTLLA